MLNAYLFHSTQEAQELSDAWLVDYNEQRPNDALGRVPPLTYLPRVTAPPESAGIRGLLDRGAYPAEPVSL